MPRRPATGLPAAAVAACVLALAGCSGAPTHAPAYAGAAPAFDAEAIVAAADWGSAPEVRVELVEYGYRPREIRLAAGRPVRLALINYSSFNHYFTAPEFFRSSATRKAKVENQAEVKAPYFTAVEVMRRGGAIDLYLVPMVPGRYVVHCHLEDHRQRGVEGLIIVE